MECKQIRTPSNSNFAFTKSQIHPARLGSCEEFNNLLLLLGENPPVLLYSLGVVVLFLDLFEVRRRAAADCHLDCFTPVFHFRLTEASDQWSKNSWLRFLESRCCAMPAMYFANFSKFRFTHCCSIAVYFQQKYLSGEGNFEIKHRPESLQPDVRFK